MTEAYTTLENDMRLYGADGKPGSQIPFNFELITYINDKSSASEYKQKIDSWMNLLPSGSRANWVV